MAIPEDGRGKRRRFFPRSMADLPLLVVIPLVIAEFAMGKRSRTGTVGTFRIFNGPKFAWMGLWTAWISTAIGFYYAVVTGWCINYFQTALRGGLGSDVDTTEVWNNFLQAPARCHVPSTGSRDYHGSDLEGCESNRESERDPNGLFVRSPILSPVLGIHNGPQ